MRKSSPPLARLLVFTLLIVRTAQAAPPDEKAVRAFFEQHCIACHGPKKAKGDLRLDQLGFDFAERTARGQWQSIFEKLEAHEMPPEEKPQPPAEELQRITRWISETATVADAERRRTQGRVVMRRLNRAEYENTVRDLLGVDTKLQDLIPLDTAANGFDNVGDALHTSSFLLDRYLEAAETVLNQAIVNRPQPPSVTKRYTLTEMQQVKSTQERVFRKGESGEVTLFSSSAWQAVRLSTFYPSERGMYRFRISTSAAQSGERPVTFQILSGLAGMGGPKAHLIGFFDVSPGAPRVVAFADKMEPRTTVSILPYGLASAQAVHKIGAETYDGPGLTVGWVEVEGPINESWPPESHRRLFGDLPQRSAPAYNQKDRVEVVSENPAADAERLLRAFVRRAFRRAITDDDVAPYAALFAAKLKEGRTFEQSVRVAYAAVLVSPSFLFLREPAGPLDQYAMASRLSYFLWSSAPDDELLRLAQTGKLREAGVRREQVERLLKSPKTGAFTENFLGQWLNLREIDFTEPGRILYPEFDEMLKSAMLQEPRLFFQEVLAHDLSLANFVASDFSMLNDRLARHYGIPGVEGREFRKVALPRESHRGGFLTMASVLKVTANGTNTSPVTRGAFVLDRIFNTPPPRPPENVAALEPDIRGATTIREQLAKHRASEACAGCHAKIDPPGFALESFDVIGGWRDHYRTTGRGKPVEIDGKRMSYLQGPVVDPADKMADGRAFQDIDELKQLLLTEKDQLARALTVKLLIYGTGAPPEPSDAAEIERIIAKARERNYGFRSLIQEIVNSQLFLTK